METIAEPGTIDDLVADAARAGHDVTARLVRDWTERGLLDSPRKRSAGKGRGSVPALYPANQRMLLLTLLHHRPGNHIDSLARIPVCIWMYWGDHYVPLRQARRALMTWLGDPRVSKQRAREAARAVLGQIDNPRATAHARRELVDAIAWANWTGKADFVRLEQAIKAVFDPRSTSIPRVIGHPEAPVMIASMIRLMKARLLAVRELLAGNVTDEALIQAREAHLYEYAEYAAKQPFLVATAPSGASLYEPVTAEDTLNNCCRDLLTVIGLELSYPANAERLRQARTGHRRPTPADVSLSSAAIAAEQAEAERRARSDAP